MKMTSQSNAALLPTTSLSERQNHTRPQFANVNSGKGHNYDNDGKTAYSVKINSLSVSSEGWNSTIYPSVADWAHSRKNLFLPMVQCIQVGPVGKGPAIGQQKIAIMHKIHSTCYKSCVLGSEADRQTDREGSKL